MNSGTQLTGAFPRGKIAFGSDGTLYGTASQYGKFGGGTLWKFVPATRELSPLVAFDDTKTPIYGRSPDGDVLLESNGILYGSTTMGGKQHNYGTLWQYRLADASFTTLLSFTGKAGPAFGIGVAGKIAMDRNGMLYGTTLGGRAFSGQLLEVDLKKPGEDVADKTAFGSLWCFDTRTKSLTTLAVFTGEQGPVLGNQPRGGVTLGSDGNLYGTTLFGGNGPDQGFGTVWTYSLATHKFTTLIEFTGKQGAAPGSEPMASVSLGPDKSLYGTTKKGGKHDQGTLWQYSLVTRRFTTLVEFTGLTGPFLGASPIGELVLDERDSLYGTACEGGQERFGRKGGFGTIWRYQRSTKTFSTLVRFGLVGPHAGATPLGSVAFGPDAQLYGTTQNGGRASLGTLWTLRLNGDGAPSFSSLAAFLEEG